MSSGVRCTDDHAEADMRGPGRGGDSDPEHAAIRQTLNDYLTAVAAGDGKTACAPTHHRGAARRRRLRAPPRQQRRPIEPLPPRWSRAGAPARASSGCALPRSRTSGWTALAPARAERHTRQAREGWRLVEDRADRPRDRLGRGRRPGELNRVRQPARPARLVTPPATPVEQRPGSASQRGTRRLLRRCCSMRTA